MSLNRIRDVGPYQDGIDTRPRSKAALIIVIIIVVILIVAMIIAFILYSRSRKPGNNTTGTGTGSGTGTGGTGNGGGGGGGNTNIPDGIHCTVNSECANNACNTATGLCVECLDNSTCTGSLPFCKTTTNKCVKCLLDGDCAAGETCVNDICCDPRKPVINSVISTTSFNSTIEVNYTMFQPVSGSTVIAVLEDPLYGVPLVNQACDDIPAQTCSIASDCPAGDSCTTSKCVIPGCKKFAAGPSFLMTENTTGITFHASTSYRIKIKIVYKCGSTLEQSTDWSLPFTFTTAACPSPVGITIGPVAVVPFSYVAIGTNVPDVYADMPVWVYILEYPGAHPNFFTTIIPAVAETTGNGLKAIYIGYPGPGLTLFVRVASMGNASQCDSSLSNEVMFVT